MADRAVSWDPAQYLRYADDRGRPFFDLLARVGAVDPARVVDVGCGPGNLTATLAERWPTAAIEGLDSSPAMLEQAAAHASDRVSFRRADASTWEPEGDVDVVVSNAALQWVPGHAELTVRWLGCLPVGGWLAFQVPGNQASPSHASLRALAATPRWREVLPPAAVERIAVLEPAEYLGRLAAVGARVDAWETTYLHVLQGDDPVLGWVRGTALRPVLDALPDDAARAAFEAELAVRLRAAYPAGPSGTVFPFRRLFVVAQRT